MRFVLRLEPVNETLQDGSGQWRMSSLGAEEVGAESEDDAVEEWSLTGGMAALAGGVLSSALELKMNLSDDAEGGIWIA